MFLLFLQQHLFNLCVRELTAMKTLLVFARITQPVPLAFFRKSNRGWCEHILSTAIVYVHENTINYVVIGIPIIGQRMPTARATTAISTTLAGMPVMKNCPVVNCFEL